MIKKNLHDPENYNVVLTHLEPDILECEVRWLLGSFTMNKASGDDGIPAGLFQILKDDGVKVLYLICQQIWKTQQWPQGWKRSVFISIPKTDSAKECSNYHTVLLISHCCSVAKLYPTVCNPMDCSMPGFPVLHCLLELLKLMCIELMLPFNHFILFCPFSSCLQSFPASGSFPVSRLFATGGQSVGASASGSVFLMNIQD